MLKLTTIDKIKVGDVVQVKTKLSLVVGVVVFAGDMYNDGKSVEKVFKVPLDDNVAMTYTKDNIVELYVEVDEKTHKSTKTGEEDLLEALDELWMLLDLEEKVEFLRHYNEKLENEEL